MPADEPARETFIPFRASDVIQMCLEDGRLPDEDRQTFRSLAQLLGSIFHFEFHRNLESLKEAYAPFDPDTDTRPLKPLSEEDKTAAQARLLEGLTAVLTKANYHELTAEELEKALTESSLFKIRLEANFDDFQDIIFFARGERREEAEVKKLFGLKRETIQFDLYDRVAVYVRFKDQAYFEEKGRKNLNFTAGSTVMKLFRNVPKADLEILFPNVEVRMRLIDKILIGIPAVIGGIVMLVTKLLSVITVIVGVILVWLTISTKHPEIDSKTLIAAGIGLGAAAAYILKQINKFKNRKIRFLKALTDQLYFKNLDNNAGVIYHLITGAEEEELKEAILAYYVLLTHDTPLSAAELDHKIEKWFEHRWDCRLDFDVEDALTKLKRLLLAKVEDGHWTVVSLEEATRRLDETWDGYYEFHSPLNEARVS